MKRDTSPFSDVEKMLFSSSNHKKNPQIALESSVDILAGYLGRGEIKVRVIFKAKTDSLAHRRPKVKTSGSAVFTQYFGTVKVRDAELPGQNGQGSRNSDGDTSSASGCPPQSALKGEASSRLSPAAVEFTSNPCVLSADVPVLGTWRECVDGSCGRWP